MILFLQIFISTNLPAHMGNPIIRFKTRNKYYAVLSFLQRKRKVVTDTDGCNENRAELEQNKRAQG